jgi:hypothetical protein
VEQARPVSNDGELKLIQLFIAIIGGAVGVIVTLLTLARWMVFWPLETGKGRARLMEGVYREFQSDAGRKEIGTATIRYVNDIDGGRATFQTLLLNILNSPEVAEQVAKLVAAREASQKLVQDNVEAVREQRVVTRTTVDEQQLAAEFRASTINVLAKDPMANLDELFAIVKRVVAVAVEKPKEPETPDEPSGKSR